ncbi:MAG: hypothetical protein REJ50_01145 [Bordetella sp.]|nr:hypothetical protein [Bordetella sp.]
MIRQIVSDSTPSETAPAAPLQPVPTAQQAAPADDPRDALAGALPAWDLLPSTGFIRRVK